MYPWKSIYCHFIYAYVVFFVNLFCLFAGETYTQRNQKVILMIVFHLLSWHVFTILIRINLRIQILRTKTENIVQKF